MLHDGEKDKLDLAVGLSIGRLRCVRLQPSVRSRPAKVGDKLNIRDFGTGMRAFAASEDANLAICVLRGTELSLHSFAQ